MCIRDRSSISESMFPLLLRGVAGKAAAPAIWNVLLAFLAGCCSVVEEMAAGVCSAGSSCLRFCAPSGGVVGVCAASATMTEGGTVRMRERSSENEG